MIILNEKEYAEECLREMTADQKKPFRTLYILAKYYYHKCGYRKKKIVQLLTEFAEIACPQCMFPMSAFEESIDKLAKNAGKHKLHEINGVWITSKELEIIHSINNAILERLAFTMLCLAKYANLRNPKNNNWVNNNAKEIFKLARISCSVKERYINLNMLGCLNLLEFPKRLDNLSCRVTYIDNEGDGVLFISDFRELGYEYLNYLGGNFTRCCECGRLFRNNKKRDRRYCNGCIGYIPKMTKTVECIDCGKLFKVKAKNNKTNRCPDCQNEHDKELRIERNKKYYDKLRR